MAQKRKNETIVLEDIELKPQVIGMTYQKRSNLPRILFIFAVLILVVYFIDDISVFVNNLLGKKTAESIQNRAMENNKNGGSNDSKDSILCTKDLESIQYNFINNELQLIKYTKNDNNVSNPNYNNEYMSVENKKAQYVGINGITTVLDKNENGYTFVITMDLFKLKDTINEPYLFKYSENSENVIQKMKNNGYNCN